MEVQPLDPAPDGLAPACPTLRPAPQEGRSGQVGRRSPLTADPTQTAVVLVCDRDYLVPTIGTALSARAAISDPAVPVLVFLTVPDSDLLARARRRAAPFGVAVEAAPIAGLSDIRSDSYAPGHVSISAMARLWLDEILDPGIGRFLYLDGDIDITGSLDPLLAMPVPTGGFLAAPDMPLLVSGESGFRTRWIRG